MKENKRVQRTNFSITGCILLFFTVAFTASVSILLFVFAEEKSGGNTTFSAWITFGNILLLTLITTLLDWLRRKLTTERPVRKILEATENITAGDFDTRVETLHVWGKYDEFDLIIENLNRMAKELSQMEVLRTDFIANVSHEIKTPLAIISNYAAAIRDGGLDESERVESADALVKAAARLSDMITDILKLNKLENMEIRPSFDTFELGEQLRECALTFEDILEAKGVELECDIDDVTLVSDAGMLDIVWNNLLSNAVKFTPSGGKVSISVKDDGDFALVRVSDTGRGMSPEEGARIFDKFFQGDKSRSFEGNGLGLALVKKVMDIVSGEIAVESTLEEGSTFSVRLKRNP